MDSGCRLCNSNLRLINIFEIPLQDAEQIRKCIELTTGLSIQQDDDMGKFVCKHCCDIAILCYKYRRNAQMNAIRIRDELLKIKASLPMTSSTTYRKPGPKSSKNKLQSTPSTSQDELFKNKSNIPSTPSSTYRKPGPKSSKNKTQSTPSTSEDEVFKNKSSTSSATYRKPGPKSSKNNIPSTPSTSKDDLFKNNSDIPSTPSSTYRKPGPKSMKIKMQSSPSTSHAISNISSNKCNISPSTSKILLQYPSLRVPKVLYTENIKPFVNLKDIGMDYNIDRDGHVDLSSPPSRQYRITKMNTTKLHLQKLKHTRADSNVSSSDVADLSDYHDDPGIMSDDSDAPLVPRKSKVSHSSPKAYSSPSKAYSSPSKAYGSPSKAYDSPSKASEAESNLLIPVTYKDEFICNICNKMLKSASKLNMHMHKYHKKDSDEEDSDESSVANYSVKSVSSASTKYKPGPKSRRKVTEVESEAESITSASANYKPGPKSRKKVTEVESEAESISGSSHNAGSTSSFKPPSKKKEMPPKEPEPVLRLTRIEEDDAIRQNYPAIFNESPRNISESSRDDTSVSNNDNDVDSVEEVSDTEPSAFRTWLPGLPEHEERKVADCFLGFLRTRIRGQPLQVRPKIIVTKDTEVQATMQLDKQFKLDSMGPNEMDILLPELSLYNIPVSILKQSPLKDTTAFFIQYSPEEAVHKPIDWSKLHKIDLKTQSLRSSTPLSNVEVCGSLSSWALPSSTSLKDF